MRILFIHQNFPGQFRHLAPALLKRGHDVTAMTMMKAPPAQWQGIKLIGYRALRSSSKVIHPWIADLETKTIRGESCYRVAMQLRANGYNPDLIVAHPGWGESMFVKDVWPEAKLGIYCEFYYSLNGTDIGFDPEFPTRDPQSDACRIRIKNLNNQLHFTIADAGLSPTKWQADTFPETFRSKISVVHDGIHTGMVTPEVSVSFPIGGDRTLTRSDEVITFVNRNLEPYRGYHIFMRALPEILARRPGATVLIVGGDAVSYGSKPVDGGSWKKIFAEEVRSQISDADWNRVHYLGKVSYDRFLAILQLSAVHVYLTYPFVLSWSLLEAMSVGCAIVASDTPPVREVIRHDETGCLVDFFDVKALAENVCSLLDDPDKRSALGSQARLFVQERYDLERVCLPGQIAWVERMMS
jgi:glycosyltransferase involved in cell wall biosynthesis